MALPTGAQCIAAAHGPHLLAHQILCAQVSLACFTCLLHLLACRISAEQLAKVLDQQAQAKYYHVRKVYDQVQAASRLTSSDGQSTML